MIKKNTKVIFEDGSSKREEELIGGIPLSKGEIIKVHEAGKTKKFVVKNKEADCFLDVEEQIVNITYLLKRRV